MSATNFVCQICGSLSPLLFALSSAIAKTPLCVNCVGKFLTSRAPGCGVYPISAIAHIHSIADVPIYEAAQKRITESETVLTTIAKAEESEYERGTRALREAKEAAISLITTEIDSAEQQLAHLHEFFSAQMHLAMGEIAAAKTQQGVQWCEMTKKVVERVELQKAPCYADFVSEFRERVENVVKSGVKIPFKDAEEYFLDYLQGKNAYKIVEIRQNESDPTKKRKLADQPTLKNCNFCATILTPQNYITISDHPDCPICIKCIKGNNHGDLSCPVCLFGYSKASKELLLTTFLGLKGNLSDKKAKLSKENCDKCSTDCSSKQCHICVGGQYRCLDCHQRLLARTCYGRKIVCPECKMVPVELYTNMKKLDCRECGRRVKMNEVKHWCEDGDYLACGNCEVGCQCGGKAAAKLG